MVHRTWVRFIQTNHNKYYTELIVFNNPFTRQFNSWIADKYQSIRNHYHTYTYNYVWSWRECTGDEITIRLIFIGHTTCNCTLRHTYKIIPQKKSNLNAFLIDGNWLICNKKKCTLEHSRANRFEYIQLIKRNWLNFFSSLRYFWAFSQPAAYESCPEFSNSFSSFIFHFLLPVIIFESSTFPLL